ncbi:hypothetical protein MMC22_006244 [Lobaria immixta]|nr:hypothetical protein [Lobaria immixta]
MDHLPFPVDPALPPVVIPYVCEGAEPYDNHGFPTFAIRQGWMPVAHESNWCRCLADVAAVRAQTWLYFGLLHEFFGDDYDRVLFVLNDTVTLQPVVTTQNLPRLLERWFDRTFQHRKTPDTKIRNLLLHAERYSQPLDTLVPSAKAISLSIKVLICSLGAAAGIVNSGIRKDETFNASPSRLLDERMMENNWCPYWVRIYSARYSVPTINYLSALTRATMVEDHGSCTTNQCVAHNVNMQHYQTKHATTSCQCNFVGPSINKISSLIQEGIVPLVRCTEVSDGRIVLDVIEADPGVEYTAISHVWSGGLGNPSSNSLPECQLRRLTQRMQNIARVESEWFWFRLIERAFKYVKVPFKNRLKSILLSCGIRTTSGSRVVFWLDTLCVPTSLEHDALRREAIDQMAFIYAGADRVLVLDPELQNINIRNLPNEQVCAYLACCAWRSRCWPYQEGRLARERVYLVADDIYHHSVGLRQIVGVNRDIKNRRIMQLDKHLVHSAVASFWEDMDSVKMVADKRGYFNDFTETWNGVSLRSTTKSEDLHSILAVLLGLSSREVLSLPLQERTKAVFQAQDSLPLALLYLPSGPKILDIKNKWIPQYPSGLLTLRYGTMRQSVDGEVLTFSVSESLSCGFLVNSAYPFYQHFCLIDDTSSEKVWIQLKGDHDRELETLYHGSSVCYVLYNHLAGNQLVSSSRDFVGARFYFSKLDEFGTVHLVYDCPLNYYYQHPLDTSEDLLEFEYSEVQGQRLRSDTSFALDFGRYNLMSTENYFTKFVIQEFLHGISYNIADPKQAAWKYGVTSILHPPSYLL